MLITVLAIVGSRTALAVCPNYCTGHGTCSPQDICSCFSGYTGVDCSLRTCDDAISFVGKLDSALNFGIDAHRSAECGRNGICNRETGACQCFPGFSGAGCSRIACPNDCSKQGACMSTQSMGLTYGPDADPSVRGDGSGPNFGGTAASSLYWEETVTNGCVCNQGRSGAACEIALCPRGDNPFTQY